MMNSSSLNSNPINNNNNSLIEPHTHSFGGLTLPANTMLNPQQVMAQNQASQRATRKQQRALYGPPVHYAQTISRATNLHLQQLMRNAAVSNQSYLVDRYQYSPATMSPQERHLFIQQQQQQQQQQQKQRQLQQQQQQLNHCESLMGIIERQAALNRPLCRCRVMYLGSSVPHITKNGLHGIQEPLRHLYPEKQFNSSKLSNIMPASNANTIDISHLSASLGIDSWLSVWSNGLLLENIDEFGCEIKRFFSIESLHYCAAVRFFDTNLLSGGKLNSPIRTGKNNNNTEENGDQNNNTVVLNGSTESTSEHHHHQQQQQQVVNNHEDQQQQQTMRGGRSNSAIRFLPLDAPLFQCPGMLDPSHPPMFAAIMRRTTGIKVLECHAFICRRDAAANALVRCCTHSYADFLSAKQLSIELCRRRRSAREINGTSASSRRVEPEEGEDEDEDEDPTYELADVITGKRRPLISESGVVTKSLNATHSTGTSNETDHSLEASSEDNYAIISKHYQPAGRAADESTERHNKPKQQQQVAGCDPQAGDRATSKDSPVSSSSGSSGSVNHEQRKKQERVQPGLSSTRSLFDDFMPLIKDDTQSSTADNQQLERSSKGHDGPGFGELAKLSHSLDMLGLASTCCEASSHQGAHQTCCSTASRRTSSNRCDGRHSKSMQNLEGPLEFSASAARGHWQPRLRTQASGGRRRKSAPGAHKAVSCQDMKAPVEFAQQADDSSRLMAPGQTNDGPPGTSLTQQQQQPRILGGSSTGEHRLMVGGSQASSMASSSTKAREQKKSSVRSRRTRPSRQEQQPRQQQAPATAYLQHPSSELQQLASHQHVAAYPPQHLYQTPVALCPPFALPGAAAAHYHPMPCYLAGAASGYHQPAGLYPPAPAIYDHSYLAAPFVADASRFALAMNGGRHKAVAPLKPPKQRKELSKSSLATRFRCLSPPVNFLISRSRPNSQNFAQVSAINSPGGGPEPIEQSASGDSENKARGNSTTTPPPPATRTSNADLADQVDKMKGEPVVVVSGEPGFISHSVALNGGVRQEKKMGWMKRLSLTMGSASGSQVAAAAAASAAAGQDQSQTDRSQSQLQAQSQVQQQPQLEEQARNEVAIREKTRAQKKRTSFLFGSLTLGRSSSGKPKLIAES